MISWPDDIPDEEERDPERREARYQRMPRGCSRPVNLDHPEDCFPILAKGLDEIGPAPEPYEGPEIMPF